MPATATLAPKAPATKPKAPAPAPHPPAHKPEASPGPTNLASTKPVAPSLPAFARSASMKPEPASGTIEHALSGTRVPHIAGHVLAPHAPAAAPTAPHTTLASAPPRAAVPAPALVAVAPSPHVDHAAKKPLPAMLTAPAPSINKEDKSHPATSLKPAPAPNKQTISPSAHALPHHIQNALENSLGMDFGGVQIHADSHAHAAASAVSARAFAYGNHIFLAGNERIGDLALIAHEAAHIVQQNGVPALQRWSPGLNDPFEREAERASAAVVRGEKFTVSERVNTPRIQRLGVSDALNYFADKANLIPGFRMFTIVLGVNPINMAQVDRSAANILRAVVEFIPGGALITKALDNYGVFDKVGNWVEQQIRTLGLVGSSIKKAVDDFISSLHWSDIFDLGGVWERAKRIFTDPIDRIKSFVSGLVDSILKFIKDAILMPLAKLAEGTRGWDLLCAVLEKNPITGDKVARNADTLIGGFMKLIGQEEVWNNLKKANAVARAWAWFQKALSDLLGFVSQIPTLFIQALKSLVIEDIVELPNAFKKVASIFADFALKFVTWAGDAMWQLLQIIFEVLAPGAIPYLKKVGAAFKTILQNPIAFVGNLVKAGKLGFQQFADNIGAHLKASFIEWLTGSLQGVYLPKSLEIREIIKFVLSVLGLTWQNIRGKLVKVVGETAVKAMEAGFDIVVALVTEGPAAAWEKIKEQLSNLKDMVMQGIMDFIIETVVKKAVAKVLSLLVPGGAFIQAIISIYDTIMVFVDKLAKIIQVVKAFLDSMMEIASGAIAGAAKKVESTLAGLLTLAISFLAGFLGLGKIADKVLAIIQKIRAPIDKAIDKVIDWIVTMAKKVFAGAKAAVGSALGWWKEKQSIAVEEGEAHTLYFSGEAATAELMVASAPQELEGFLASKAAEAEKDPKKKEALKSIKPHIAKIKSLSKLPDDQQRLKDAEFRAAFNSVGQYLIVLLGGSDWGSEANPLPLEYTKRPAAAYPIIYLGPKCEKRIPQDLLAQNSIAEIRKLLSKEEDADWARGGRTIVKCLPTAQTPLPDGSASIGVTDEYQIAVGKKLAYSPGKTEGGGLINRALQPYGYRAQSEKNDGDHVVEMQIGGPNILPNLWPLEKGENRSSGAKLAATKVSPDGKDMYLEEAYKKKKKSLWLVIVKTL
jgi:hypothetical protein